MPGFFGIDAAHREAAGRILKAITPAPKTRKAGEKPLRTTISPWVHRVYGMLGQDAEVERIIHAVAGDPPNPVEVRRIKAECNILEIATAYAFKASEIEGLGYSIG